MVRRTYLVEPILITRYNFVPDLDGHTAGASAAFNIITWKHSEIARMAETNQDQRVWTTLQAPRVVFFLHEENLFLMLYL